MLRIGIDTGGTFTDIAVLGARGLRVHKVSSTPADPAEAVLRGLALARDGDPSVAVDLVHGTTVGLNAILTGTVARTAFVTNEGFTDLCEIGRQDRHDIYDLDASRAVLPVPRALRFPIDSRRAADGTLLAKPGRDQLRALRERIAKARVDAIAVGLLHSYAHPEDERTIAAALRSLKLPITCSSDVLPVHGEFERFAAAILNAAIRPIMGAYLARLDRATAPGTLRLLRSSGGIMSGSEATEFPARAVFSGPAGGVQATAALAHALRTPRVAALDMGGTSTDVALVQDATPAVTDAPTVAGIPLALPALDVHTVGCGGGSIAFADAGGALRVGPQSAGASPGPACYGVGDAPTVTDAHMALGHLGADTLLQGDFPVDPDRSVHAIERLARTLGIRPHDCARGILEIADVAMMRALLVITVERAVDPASVPLVAYGGAGGLHAASLATRLSMPFAIVPTHPGAFSAIGLALAGETQEELESVLRPLAAVRRTEIDRRLRALGDTAQRRLDEPDRRATLRCEARLRYVGQGSGLWITVGRGRLDAAFARVHDEHFGFVPEHTAIELVELKAVASLPSQRLPRARPTRTPTPEARRRRGPLGGRTWTVHARRSLPTDTRLTGPCLIEELTAVTIVPPGFTARVGREGLFVPRAT